MEEPVVDPDIRRARTLPSSWYSDSTIFEQLISKFSSHWHFAGHGSDLGENNAIPLPHFEGQTREPLLMTRTENGLNCISNVCTHRGMIIQSEPCDAKVLQCPYHGRTFDLNGIFRNMPAFENVEDFPTKDDNLKQFPTGDWNGLIFASINPEKSFEEWIQPVRDRMSWWTDRKEMKRDLSRDRDWIIETNWALYVDNYLEGFHIPFVHADLNSVLDYNDYTTELFDGGVLQVGIASDGEPFFDIPESSPDHGKKIAAYYWWLFPGLMLNIYPWGISVNIVVPESVETTRVIYQGYVTDPEMLGQGAGGDLDKVEIEDQFVVEGCLRGVKSSAYDRGRYSPKMERGVHHFHRMLTRGRLS